jgi:hypothetical protein
MSKDISRIGRSRFAISQRMSAGMLLWLLWRYIPAGSLERDGYGYGTQANQIYIEGMTMHMSPL